MFGFGKDKTTSVVTNGEEKRNKTIKFALVVAGIVFVYGFLIGGSVKGDVTFIDACMNNMFNFNIFDTSVLFTRFQIALIITTIYSVFVFVYIGGQGNFRFGEEYGNSKWANPKKICAIYSNQEDPLYNKLLTENVMISYNNEKAARNANTLVIGGSGAGKTFRYAIPNLLQGATSFVDIDPKGEHLGKAGARLIRLGYDVKVLNLINIKLSDGYNPFNYIRKDEADQDIERLVDIIFEASTGGRNKSQDPFWDDSAKNVILALMYYVYYELPPTRRHFGSVMELKEKTMVSGSSGQGMCEMDALMEKLDADYKARGDTSIAVKYWNAYKGNDVKVKRDIMAVVNSKLLKFNNPELVNMTRFDDMDFDTLGKKKRVLFIVISDTDKSMNFIISMMYMQLFQRLFSVADTEYQNGLPIHVHVLMDEFSNIKLPEDFEQYLSTMRSRNVSASIILQNLAQIKNLYEKSWESIVGNCDTLLYLGGNEFGTGEYISKMLGKYTLDTKNFSNPTSVLGGGGSSSETKSQIARELLSPDEIRKMDNRDCILLIRGEDPILDRKINVLKRDIAKYSYYDKSEDGSYYEKKIEPMFAPPDEEKDQLDPSLFDYEAANQLDVSSFKFITSTEITQVAQAVPV